MKVLVLCLFLIYCASALSTPPSKIDLISKWMEVKEDVKRAAIIWRGIQSHPGSHQVRKDAGDMSVECALCGIVVNEIEGFVAENITEQEIEDTIKQDICSQIPGFEPFCNSIVEKLPQIINYLENDQTVSVVCVDFGFCDKPFPTHSDPQTPPEYIINLDLPPDQRWKEICSVPLYQNVSQYLVNTVVNILPGKGNIINELGLLINQYYLPTEYGQEIAGCASQLGIPVGWATWLNLGYEVSDDCTSIVAQTTDGKILHARNLDFGIGMGFTDSLKEATIQIQYQKGGKTLFYATSFAGYVGVLSGMKPNGFSVTIDTRFYPEGVWEFFYEIIAAIQERNASLVSFLTREVFMNEQDFESAVENLSKGELIADVYFIVAGVSSNQGAVITRNRLNATDVWTLDSPTRWFEVQTNYDHWQQPPWYDNRVTPANDAMTHAVGQSNLSLQNMFSRVLSLKPVLNIQTTYSILTCPADGSYTSYVRYCQYPCVE